MGWVGIQESGIAFGFQALDSFDTVTLADSVVEGIDVGGSSGFWTIFGFASPVRLRITAQEYVTNEFAENPGRFSWQPGTIFVYNANDVDDPTFFTPSPFEVGPADSIDFSFGDIETGGSFSFLIEVETDVTDAVNCDCNDTTNNKTLKDLRDDLMRRMGWGAQVDSPPPGVTEMLNSFLQEAQELLYRRYHVLRTERFFSWPLTEGVRLYYLCEKSEAAPQFIIDSEKCLDPRSVTWVGIERDGIWSPLVCGIPPELYSHDVTGRPERYEIRQCIEVWPPPEETLGSLVIKGHFGLEAFVADTDKLTIDDRAVFLLALANAKSHYRQADANNYVNQLEVLIDNLVAGSHHTRRYVPGPLRSLSYIYPKPTVPFQ